MNASFRGFYNVERVNDVGPDWSLRFQLQLLLPR